MKFNQILLIFSLLFFVLMVISSVSATENSDYLTEDSLALNVESNDINMENQYDVELALSEDSLVSSPKTIVVEEVEEDHNEMSEPTIQTAINSASSGDTILIKGKSYVHCHFIVDKKLNIVSDVSTTMGVCSSTAYSGYKGIFYLTKDASGTVIDGFTINNDVSNANDYGILVSEASDVVIKNCKITNKRASSDLIRIENAKNVIVHNVTLLNSANELRIKNSQNVTIQDSGFKGSKYGIYVLDSQEIRIESNDISENKMAGIAVAGNSENITVISNNITEGNIGVNLTVAKYVYILNNYIAFNTRYGVYVNCNITKMDIKGNFINQNEQYDIFNDHRVQNLFVKGGEEKQVITNNYMIGHGERPVWRQVYEYRPGEYVADYTYDETTDTYTYVGDNNGDYYGHQSGTFLGYIFEVNEMLNCPNIFFYYPTEGVTPWTKTGNYKLKLSEIIQNSKGVYSISIVDAEGNIARDISSVPVTFYLNKVDRTPTPQEGDVYKVVVMKNGTATVKFANDDFNESGNILLASFPGIGNNVYSAMNRPYKTLNIADNDIPGRTTKTQLLVSNLNTYPNSNAPFTATLTDLDGNPISGENITFRVNSNSYTVVTNAKGQASINVKFSSFGSYDVVVIYEGNDVYGSASSTALIIVDKIQTRFVAPKLNVLPNTYSTYTFTLKTSDGKALANQNVSVYFVGKTFLRTTDAKGQACINVNLYERDYPVGLSYAGDSLYKDAEATGNIHVSKAITRFVAPKLNVLPNTYSTYIFTLKTSDGKALANQNVSVYFVGKTFLRTTDAKGQACINVNLYERDYPVGLSYAGNSLYEAVNATGIIHVSKGSTSLISYDKTFAKDANKDYSVTLKDDSGNVLASQNVVFTFNNKSLTRTTNSNGIATVNLNSTEGSFDMEIQYGGSDKYKAISNSSKITISDKTGIAFVDEGLPNSEIQKILNDCSAGGTVEFLGDNYFDIALKVKKSLNITSNDRTILNAKPNSPVFKITGSDVEISGFSLVGDSSDAVVISGASNVKIIDNSISNVLDELLIEDYMDSTIPLPGYGINIFNSNNVEIKENIISCFESGIYAQDSNKLNIHDNSLRENNYGIKYGFGVSNTNITSNIISENIGLYTMEVPEGPRGYGIFLNNSAVNVLITKNTIIWNHMGISIDSNYSTGIVITSNLISDNVLEGIRFNEGYDLAENAVEPKVTDNAIYRNARGPSMMILGELSANPAGIYGPGVFNDSLKLKLDSNWYGKNQIVTWDNETGIIGYGTMCPRIKTTGIAFDEIKCVTPGKYSITFYKEGKVASNLPKFEMFATLNDNVEVVFNVVKGVGTFKFNSKYFNNESNEIKVSIGSLSDPDRIFKVEMSRVLNENEIPI